MDSNAVVSVHAFLQIKARLGIDIALLVFRVVPKRDAHDAVRRRWAKTRCYFLIKGAHGRVGE
jgi:hypothetical protein